MRQAGFEFVEAEGGGAFFTARFRHQDGREMSLSFDRIAWSIAANPSRAFQFRNHRYLGKALDEALRWASLGETYRYSGLKPLQPASGGRVEIE